MSIATTKKFLVAEVDAFAEEGGTAARIQGRQIAIFYFKSRNEWYATDNTCPHTVVNVLSRGLLGDSQGEPKITCPMHKKSFSLKSGECLGEEKLSIHTYPVSIENGMVYVEMELDGFGEV